MRDYQYYLIALALLCIITLGSIQLFPYIHNSNIIMLYILGVVIVTSISHQHQGPGIFTAILSTLTYDFFFVPPYDSFSVSDIQYLITLLIMLVVSQTISSLMLRLQHQTEATQIESIKAETERIKNVLLTSISHDMKTPLTIIMGSAEALLQQHAVAYQERYELVLNVLEEAKRLNGVIDNVMRLVKLESKSITLRAQHVLVDTLLRQVISRYPEQQMIRIQTEIGPRLPAISIDKLLMEQVLTNIIDNAIKFSEKNSPIMINARAKGKFIQIKIVNLGPGVPDDELERIFDKFYRSDKPLSSQGFGLGLAISKIIMQLHHGKIWAENLKTGGMAFYLLLPIENRYPSAKHEWEGVNEAELTE